VAETRTSQTSLWRTLVRLRGNPRACVWTEPLWGLSMALVFPYASVFMLAVGLEDHQIGLLATVGMLSPVVFALLGGVITDKMGRRWTTAWFDVVAWVIPSIIWAVAQNFWFFLGAALINGAWQVTQNSWDCLMVEDADRADIPRIYALVKIAADCSALFAPIAALLVSQWGLEPAARVLYVNAAVVMTIKIVWLYKWSHETGTGELRMADTRGESLSKMLAGYHGVLRLLLRNRGSVFAMAITAVFAAVMLVNTTFWQVLAATHLHVPDALLPFFPMARSILSVLLFFTVIPRLMTSVDLKHPTLWGLGAFLAGQLLLQVVPTSDTGATAATYAVLFVCLLLDSFGMSMLFMLTESLVALHVDVRERSRVMAIQRTCIMLAAAPFGWIAGWLSGMDRTYPFLLTAALLVVGLILVAVRWVPTHAGDDVAGALEDAAREATA